MTTITINDIDKAELLELGDIIHYDKASVSQLIRVVGLVSRLKEELREWGNQWVLFYLFGWLWL